MNRTNTESLFSATWDTLSRGIERRQESLFPEHWEAYQLGKQHAAECCDQFHPNPEPIRALYRLSRGAWLAAPTGSESDSYFLALSAELGAYLDVHKHDR